MTTATATAAPPEPGAIESRTAHLVGALAQGDFQAASRDFGDRMKSALPPDKLAATWQSLTEQVGALQGVESIELQSKDGNLLAVATAKFEKADLLIRVGFDPEGQVIGLFFAPKPAAVDWTPPEYADLAAFEDRPVQVGSQPALPGVLSMPKGAGPFPAVVLVHGSGPNDEDETVGGVKVFKDLAAGLASRGVAVLRYVKRSRHSPAGVVTQKEEVEDAARDAIALLRATPGVDPARVFLLGHSQGGYLAPRIARDNPDLAGLVLLAGSTRPLQDSMLEQLTYFASLDPANAAVLTMLEATGRFKTAVEDPSLSPDQTVELPTGGSVTGAYFLDVRGYDPAALAASLPVPMLILQGERDYQVTLTDYQGWRSALASRSDVVFKQYPSLNHLFVAGEGTPSPAEYQLPGHVHPAVVADIAAFLAGAAPAAAA